MITVQLKGTAVYSSESDGKFSEEVSLVYSTSTVEKAKQDALGILIDEAEDLAVDWGTKSSPVQLESLTVTEVKPLKV